MGNAGEVLKVVIPFHLSPPVIHTWLKIFVAWGSRSFSGRQVRGVERMTLNEEIPWMALGRAALMYFREWNHLLSKNTGTTVLRMYAPVQICHQSTEPSIMGGQRLSYKRCHPLGGRIIFCGVPQRWPMPAVGQRVENLPPKAENIFLFWMKGNKVGLGIFFCFFLKK